MQSSLIPSGGRSHKPVEADSLHVYLIFPLLCELNIHPADRPVASFCTKSNKSWNHHPARLRVRFIGLFFILFSWKIKEQFNVTESESRMKGSRKRNIEMCCKLLHWPPKLHKYDQHNQMLKTHSEIPFKAAGQPVAGPTTSHLRGHLNRVEWFASQFLTWLCLTFYH